MIKNWNYFLAGIRNMRSLIIILIIVIIIVFGWIYGKKYLFPVKTSPQPVPNIPRERPFKGSKMLDWMYKSSLVPSEEEIEKILVDFHEKLSDTSMGVREVVSSRYLDIYYEVYESSYPFKCLSSTFREDRVGLTPEMIQSMEKVEPNQIPVDYASMVRDWVVRLQVSNGVPYFDVSTMRFPLEMGEHIEYSYISYDMKKGGRYDKSRIFRIFALKK